MLYREGQDKISKCKRLEEGDSHAMEGQDKIS